MADHSLQAFGDGMPLECGLSGLIIKDLKLELADLKTFMNIRTVINLAGIRAIRDQDAAKDVRGFRSIGKGLCAEIFTLSTSGKVIKKLHPNHPRTDLWMDVIHHRKTWEVITTAKYMMPELALHVPRVHGYHPTGSLWWLQYGQSFPAYAREHNDILISERIYTMPAAVCNALIDAYCPDELVTEEKGKQENRDCLVRVYLGRRINTPPKSREWTGLRNFEADLSILADLIGTSDIMDHARSMGVALACMHFDAKHDARDVEFVLGTGPADIDITAAEIELLAPFSSLELHRDAKRRTVQLWLLDFNQCRWIDMHETDMDRAVQAYFDNDPYYPRAVPADHEDHIIWTVFRDAYLSRAAELGHRDLASYFCDQVAAECAKRASKTPKLPPKAATRSA